MGEGARSPAVQEAAVLDEAFRALLCGPRADCGLIVQASEPNGSRLDIVTCGDPADIVSRLAQAALEERPFEVVVVAASAWRDDDATRLIAAVLSADPGLHILVHGKRIMFPLSETSSRVTFVLSQADVMSLRQVALALASRCRAIRALASTRSELDAAHRAYRAVSSEFARQNKQLQGHEEQLRVQNELFDAALNNMSQGLCMFDSEARLVVRNERYLEMYGLSPHVVRAGCSLRDILAHRVQAGTFAGDLDQYCTNLMATLAR